MLCCSSKQLWVRVSFHVSITAYHLAVITNNHGTGRDGLRNKFSFPSGTRRRRTLPFPPKLIINFKVTTQYPTTQEPPWVPSMRHERNTVFACTTGQLKQAKWQMRPSRRPPDKNERQETKTSIYIRPVPGAAQHTNPISPSVVNSISLHCTCKKHQSCGPGGWRKT